ncbi:DUF1622 domain-containing protein [Actinoplanes sp. NPDC049668]|uniref:DUF1622 domain-containing protein n=1 Tax=unclassified Actinoplanes TaxID=2626549 RepID=UPI0033B0E89C
MQARSRGETRVASGRCPGCGASAPRRRARRQTPRDGDRRSAYCAYRTLRATFGGALLLGIEVLVAADLIRTVAVTPTLTSVTVLGLIVLIRTFLSFSLGVEIDGTLPGRRGPQPER